MLMVQVAVPSEVTNAQAAVVWINPVIVPSMYLLMSVTQRGLLKSGLYSMTALSD